MKYLSIVGLLALVVTCTNFDNSSVKKSGVISGKALVVGSATVTATDARTGGFVARTTTRDDGSFALDMGVYSGDVVVSVTGGVYPEGATGTVSPLGQFAFATAVTQFGIAESREGIAISPLTHLALARAKALQKLQKMTFADAVTQAWADFNAFWGCSYSDYDIVSAFPTDPTLQPNARQQVDVHLLAGVVIAGLSQQAKMLSDSMELTAGVRITTLSVLDALTQDIQDSVFDGKSSAGNLSIYGAKITSNTLRADKLGLPQAMRRFLESERNATGVKSTDLEDTLVCLSSSAGALFVGEATGDYDHEGPSIIVVSPKPEAVLSGTVTIQLEAEDPSGIASLKFSPEQTFITETGRFGSGTQMAVVGTLKTSQLRDGEIVVSIVAEDSIGNRSDVYAKWVIDNQAPVISIGSPSADIVRGVVPIRATASDPQGISLLQTCDPLIIENTSTDPSVFEGQWNTALFDDGIYTLQFCAIDTEGHSSRQSVAVTIDNFTPGRIVGKVALESPVRKSQIEAWTFRNGVRERLLSSAYSEDGTYSLNAVDDYTGPVLVRASGNAAMYQDAATGETAAFRFDDELFAIIDYKPSQVFADVQVNALTTLIATLASGYHNSGRSWPDSMSRASQLISEHFQRPGAFDVLHVATADFSSASASAQSRESILAGLFHAGLSRYGAEAAAQQNVVPSSLRSVYFLRLLLRDLEDNRLDGKDGLNQSIAVLGSVALDTDTLRSRLAAATARWLDSVPLVNNFPTFANPTDLRANHFNAPGDFLDDMASNTSELFGAGVPSGYDRTGPEVTVSDLPDYLTGDILIPIAITDSSGVGSVQVSVDGRRDVISTDCRLCVANANGLVVQFHTSLVQDGEHIFTVLALDSVGNATVRTWTVVVDNSPPVLQIDNVAELTGTTLLPISGSVRDEASQISSITVSITQSGGTEKRLVVHADDDSLFDENVILPTCDDRFTVRVIASDSAGNKTQSRDYTVACDSSAPEIRLLPSQYTPENYLDANYSADGSTLLYAVSKEAKQTEISTVPSWPMTTESVHFVKYFNRLDNGAENIPVLRLDIDDSKRGAARVWSSDADLQLSYRYLINGQEKRGWSAVAFDAQSNAFIVPMTYQSLHPDLAKSKATDKHSIELRLTDKAANISIYSYLFQIEILAPPVYFGRCEIHSMLSNYQLPMNNVHQLFTVPGRTAMLRSRVSFLTQLPANSLAPSDVPIVNLDDEPLIVNSKVDEYEALKEFTGEWVVPATLPPSSCRCVGNRSQERVLGWTTSYNCYNGWWQSSRIVPASSVTGSHEAIITLDGATKDLYQDGFPLLVDSVHSLLLSVESPVMYDTQIGSTVPFFWDTASSAGGTRYLYNYYYVDGRDVRNSSQGCSSADVREWRTRNFVKSVSVSLPQVVPSVVHPVFGLLDVVLSPSCQQALTYYTSY